MQNKSFKYVLFSCIFVVAAIFLLAVGFVAGTFISSQKYSSFLGSISLKRENDPTYPFVHQIVGISTPEPAPAGQFGSLTKKIQGVFNDNKNILSRYSVYFRDQTNGFWVGINENDNYDPASMLKVALAIGAYKESENNPNFLGQSFVYTSQLAALNTGAFDSPSELRVGKSYTIGDLVEKMIVDSDNGAKDAIGNAVDSKIMDDVYNYLSITIPTDNSNYTISAKKYTAFFRALYNGVYLNKEDSNKLLDMLGRTNFDDGLVAGVPTNVPVSHKFGEHVNTSDNTVGAVELHDCGIIYESSNPYVLCVMTQGKDESDLADVIAAVSKVVYQEVTNGYK